MYITSVIHLDNIHVQLYMYNVYIIKSKAQTLLPVSTTHIDDRFHIDHRQVV